MAYSKDVRRRVIKFVRQGGRRTEAARRYGISLGTVYCWLRQGDDALPGKPGPKGSHKLDRKRLAMLIEQKPDMKRKDLSATLGVVATTIWRALRQMRMSQKNRMLRRGITQ